jgi:phage gp36-like protein
MSDRFGEYELIQLTDRSKAGVIDATVLNQSIHDAAGKIDQHLRQRHTLPLAFVPPELIKIACDIAYYFLFGNSTVPKDVREHFEDALKDLRDEAAGLISWGIDEAGQSTVESHLALPEMQSAESAFGRGADW